MGARLSALLRALLGASLLSVSAVGAATCYPDLPRPRVDVTGSEDYSTPSGKWTRFLLDIKNKASFPDDLFAAAPDLPPCGLNANSSRTWVNILDADGNHLYGFCGLTRADDLDAMWFAIPLGSTPPATITVQIVDRLCGTTYSSSRTKVPVPTGADRAVAFVRVGTDLSFSSLPGTDGHSWIEILSLDGRSSESWGTWSSSGLPPRGRLHHNLERDGNRSPAVSRSRFVTQKEYDRLQAVIRNYASKGDRAWSAPKKTCVEFAKDAWRAVSRESIDTIATIGGVDFGLPIEVLYWTIGANEGLSSRTTNTCNSAACPSSCPSYAFLCR